MTKISYSKLEESIAYMMRWNPRELDEEEIRLIRRAVTAALETIWNYYWWPDLILTKQFTFHPPWKAGTYANGAIVFHVPSWSYYVVLSASTSTEPAAVTDGVVTVDLANWAMIGESLGAQFYSPTRTYVRGEQCIDLNDFVTKQLFASSSLNHPPSDSAYWGYVPNLVRIVPTSMSGQPTIGLVKAVYAVNPDGPNAVPTGFSKENGGILARRAGLRPWIKFLPVPPRLHGENWDPTVAYSVIDPELNCTPTPNP